MIESKDIKNMVAHILRRDKGIADTHIMHPAREWFIGLGISTIVVLLGSWFCFYLYQYYSTEMSKEVLIIESAVPYNAANVKSALEVFEARQKRYNEILGTGNAVVLPQSEDTPTSTLEVVDVVEVEPVTPEPESIINQPPVSEDDDIPATLAP
jgi:hypothetical protein